MRLRDIMEGTEPFNFDGYREAGQQYLDGRTQKQFLEAVDAFEKAFQGEDLYNAQFKELYTYGFAKGFESLVGKLKDHVIKKRGIVDGEVMYYGKPHQLSAYGVLGATYENEGVPSLDGPASLQSVGKILRELSKVKDKFPEEYEFFSKFADAKDMIKALKGMVQSGRKPAPRDPNKFYKPMADRSAIEEVSGFLKEAVNDTVRKELKSQRLRILTSIANDLQGIELNADGIKKLNDSEKFVFRTLYDFEIYDVKKGKLPTLKQNYESILEALAERETNDIIEGFVAKNTSKLALIFTKKESVTEHKIIHNNVRNGCLENLMYFKFSDGSNFMIDTKTVYSWSSKGKFFVRFPTRFGNVVMADGSNMSMPSEEKMIKEF